MSSRVIFATVIRILRQVRRDRMSLALLLGAPTIVMGILSYMLSDIPGAYNKWGSTILAIFPLVMMFIVTSVATLRERTSGTLERLMSLPVSKMDFSVSYAISFSFLAIVQATFLSFVSFVVFGLETKGSIGMIILIATLNGLVGTGFGLVSSSLAKTEFQAVQFMPLTLFPQILLCGLIVPRDFLPTGLKEISNIIPLSYAMDAVKEATVQTTFTDDFIYSISILGIFTFALLLIGATTIKRRTP